MATKVETETINLILENGESIEVTIPEDVIDEVMDEIREAQSRDTFWWADNYTNVRAWYKGYYISSVNMKRVVGMT